MDKTLFIKEWWEGGDSVTLITRPQRFGKTMNMSMLETFFSAEYVDRADLFESLSIWEEEKYRELQGTSCARVKEADYLYRYYGKKVIILLDEYGLREEEEKIRFWYDSCSFGKYGGIYNPWSILNFLDTGIFTTYWANTSANTLVSNLLKGANPDIKSEFEELLKGNSIHKTIDEQIVYEQLGEDESAIWTCW